LKKFLVGEKGFAENRVESALRRIDGALQKSAQNRLENFFTFGGIIKSTNQTSEKDKV
jgi:hypothetical protein